MVKQGREQSYLMDSYSVLFCHAQLWVNGKRKQEVSNPSCNKALIDDVDLKGRVEFSIQTIGEGELCSEKCHFAITGALSTLVRKGTEKL